jgi:predicted nuclease of restriction endonuclease-like RecB superfamily
VPKKKKLKNKFEIKLDRQIKKSGLPYKYEGEKIPYYFTGHYIPDFVIKTPKGTLYIEAKGYLRPEHKRKMVAVKRLHPTLDIRIVFYSENKKYIKWATKHGFPFCISVLPTEWLI